MPIRLIPPQGARKSYYVRGTYLGQYVDRSTKTGKRAVAAQVLKATERDIERGTFSQPGDPTFASAAAAYMKAGGERTYLKRLLEHFGETPLRGIDQSAIDRAALALYPAGTGATRNRSVYTPISAIMRHIGARIDLRRPAGSGGRHQTAWLWPEQAFALFQEAEKLNPQFSALLIVLCYTGMRLSEALNLTWDNVRLADGFATIRDTKNGEPRGVFLPPMAVAAIANMAGRVAKPEFVFAFSKSGHLYSLLRAAAAKAEISLPERSAFHILRHTYATWMRRYGGADSQALIATGAWKDRKSVDRYVHTVVSEEAQRAMALPTPKTKSK
jgi:integrase